ncbi:hypothetical protein J4E93_005448 [Alternaria ventricosa]|uniref:uncharacterized protein n=1 Tax=Alternaria ventricosa TaxID=1187951 RepID=UPI0020C37417|nr:uncharacterized protein J4E93_005448 [Alternaria ventricosa]KAI4645870.1 hypothetical protein J4E93_005448 [Alternaria ventricosa]
MDTHNLFKYQGRPLNASRREIRLLHLHPSSTERITATLSVKDLASAAGTFACVSYVWGDPNKTVPIEVDDQEVQITTNLFKFLCHIRDSNETLTLWADAICINQADLNEKSQQVVMMGDIYSGCSVVHIWLGTISHSLPPGTAPFAWIEHMAEGKHWHTLPGILEEQDAKPSEEFTNHRLAFDLMVSSPWWQRAWTVQEVILPKSTILWYGTYHTTWNSFAQAIRNQDTRVKNCCLPNTPETKKHWLKIKVIDAFMYEHETINWFREYYHGSIATIPGHTSAIEGVMPFQETLLSFSKRQCHDLRDKVFSILALAPPRMFENYKPDYTESLAEFWTDVYRLMLDHTVDVSAILQGNGFGPNNDGRPSWVRDLANMPIDPMYERHRISLAGMYQCSAGSLGTFISTDKWELHVKARKADIVRHVGASHTFKSGPRAMMANMRQWHKLAVEALSCTDEAVIQKPFQRAICATLHSMREGSSWRRSTDEDLPSLEDWQEFLDLEPDVFPFHATYLAPIIMATEDRCFYITEKGNMGLANPGLKPGDEVCALMGMRVPVVLRKAEGERNNANAHHFIGDCFLLDHMDGEIMRNEEETKGIVLL